MPGLRLLLHRPTISVVGLESLALRVQPTPLRPRSTICPTRLVHLSLSLVLQQPLLIGTPAPFELASKHVLTLLCFHHTESLARLQTFPGTAGARRGSEKRPDPPLVEVCLRFPTLSISTDRDVLKKIRLLVGFFPDLGRFAGDERWAIHFFARR
jgi:hypothetical protein